MVSPTHFRPAPRIPCVLYRCLRACERRVGKPHQRGAGREGGRRGATPLQTGGGCLSGARARPGSLAPCAPTAPMHGVVSTPSNEARKWTSNVDRARLRKNKNVCLRCDRPPAGARVFCSRPSTAHPFSRLHSHAGRVERRHYCRLGRVAERSDDTLVRDTA